MLEGLEISEVSFSEVETNKDERTDSDFWTKKLKKNPKLNYARIGDCLVVSQYGISIEMNEDKCGYPIYRMNEIHNMLCDFDVNKHADISSSEMQIFKLNDRDVLFNRTNSYEWVGRTGVYRKIDEQEFVFASYLVRFVPDRTKLLPEYLATFLSTKYGVSDIKRRSRQSINQTNVNPEEVKEIDIPLLDLSFQNKLKNNFDKAYEWLKTSKILYAQAEQTLLEAVGLADFKPSTQNTNIKTFAQSFGTSGRLDAEYYQPKYEKIEKSCFENAVYTKRVKDFRVHNGRGLQPEYIEDGELNVINSRHILERELDYKNFEKTNLENWDSQAKAQIFRNDILTYTTGANIGRTQVYLSDEKALASNHVNILRLENENAVYVAFVLNSIVGRLQTEQLSAGSAQQELYPKDIDNFYVPFVESETQTNISQLLQQSFALKAQSEHLLNVAKRAVEIAIEADEQTAVAYINEQTGEKS